MPLLHKARSVSGNLDETVNAEVSFMNDNEELIRTLTTVHRYDDEQIDAFVNKVKTRSLQKGGYLLKEGQICSFLAFVEKGGLRFYSSTEVDELTLYFFTEHQWATDYESLLSHTPSSNSIQATENTELKIITLDDLHLLLAQFPEFRNIMKVLNKSIITSDHLKSVINTTPDERYKKLLNTYPEWINRFPQMHIASYLGMTKETFSRVKARVK
jgi:CRP/FNR family transcriptional regulator, anaerobic regulatory protein